MVVFRFCICMLLSVLFVQSCFSETIADIQQKIIKDTEKDEYYDKNYSVEVNAVTNQFCLNKEATLKQQKKPFIAGDQLCFQLTDKGKLLVYAAKRKFPPFSVLTNAYALLGGMKDGATDKNFIDREFAEESGMSEEELKEAKKKRIAYASLQTLIDPKLWETRFGNVANKISAKAALFGSDTKLGNGADDVVDGGLHQVEDFLNGHKQFGFMHLYRVPEGIKTLRDELAKKGGFQNEIAVLNKYLTPEHIESFKKVLTKDMRRNISFINEINEKRKKMKRDLLPVPLVKDAQAYYFSRLDKLANR